MTDKQKIIRLEFENKVLKQTLADIKKKLSNAEDLTETKSMYFGSVRNPYREKDNDY
tara:strand:+ start:249 stop:419 length:171 start_codon:yes stop_codon:yes gene_type:complete